MKVEKVKAMVVVVVVETDVLVWIGERKRGRSSTLQDTRPARKSDRERQERGCESDRKSTTRTVINTGRQLVQQLLLKLWLGRQDDQDVNKGLQDMKTLEFHEA